MNRPHPLPQPIRLATLALLLGTSAFLQILLLMALLFRSFRGALVCPAPNLAPLVFIFVMMGTVGIAFDIATGVIAGAILDITVDDTIHHYHGYQHRIHHGVSPVFAITCSVETTGRAVIAISVVLIAQFSLPGLRLLKPNKTAMAR